MSPKYAFLLTNNEAGNPMVIDLDYKTYRFNEDKFELFQTPPYSQNSVIRKKIKPVICAATTLAIKIRCYLRGGWLEFENPEKIPLNFVNSKAVEDRQGNLWIAFLNSGLHKYAPDGKLTIYQQKDGLPGSPIFLVPGEEKVRLLTKDIQGAIWLTDLETMKSELVTRQPPKLFDALSHAAEDLEGSIWIGTNRGGLFRLRKQTITAYSKAEGVADNNVYPIYEDKKGIIWVGTTHGLFRHENGSFELVKGTEQFNVEAIGETPDHRLLVSSSGTRIMGVFVLEGNQVKRFSAVTQIVNYTFYTDEENTLWTGGRDGLIRVKDDIETKFDENDGLAANDVKIIIGDGAGGMWIGSYGGLTHFKNGKFEKWTEKEGLPARTIRSLYLDSENVLWIGSYDSGLVRFKGGKFTHYTSQIGLFNDGAFQILEDGQRSFWISSNRGIYRVKKDELNEFAEGKRSSISSVAYGKSDGMLNAECNGGRSPGGIKARDGRLWFPTQDSVAVIDPGNVKSNPKPPPVIIEDVKIDGKSVSPEAAKSEIFNPESQIELVPGQNNFEIKYTALSFINSENLRFKYKLDGIDTEWTEAGTRRIAYFSYIPPGDYTFKVIAANADGVWNESGQSIKVKISPVFYRTRWFYLLSVLTVSGLVFLFFRWRISQIEGQRLVQQNFSRQLIASQEAERKRIAAELHDGLGQRLVVIKNLIWMTLNRKETNDLNQLEEISDEASQAISEVKAISYNLRPYQLDRMGLTRAIEGIIRSAKNSSEIDFSLEIDNIDNYFPKEMEINFYRIIQESVNNIIKHSKATKAKIRIKRDEKSLDIMIRDNGQGFQMDEEFNAKSKIQNPKSEGGFGLIGVRERIDLLGGKAEINTAPGRGTELKITIIK
ncbi:MAG: hypothetical protein K1X72_19980 [Pyrinomonadaceae bacterium]|nr:hypothetical protein [Pyrinomonadaceae bacterium]